MKYIKCKSCDGRGYLLAFPPVRKNVAGKMVKIPPIKCPDCEGCGNVEVDPEWRHIGENLKQNRMKTRTTLRKFCIENDLDPVIVSRAERGLIKCPKEVLVANNKMCMEAEK